MTAIAHYAKLSPRSIPIVIPTLVMSAWNFGDEVLRWFFHGHSLSDSKDLLIPFLQVSQVNQK